MESDYLVVYGTLRRGAGSENHAVLAAAADFVGEATIPGELYMITWFPGLVPTTDPGSRVHGEVYRLHDSSRESLLAALDDYEDYDPHSEADSLFLRKITSATLATGASVDAWVYYFNRSTGKDRHIESGDFLAERSRRT